MNFLKKIIFISILFFACQNYLFSDIPYFVDFKYILNESKAGKEAQNYLKKKLNDGIKNLKNKEETIKKEEKKIIQQRKIISAEEYKKKVNGLRDQVSKLQKDRDNLFETVSKQRSKARNELLKNLNPIIKEYMKEKKIRMVLDKKGLLLADENLDITQDIIKILNNKLKSIKLN